MRKLRSSRVAAVRNGGYPEQPRKVSFIKKKPTTRRCFGWLPFWMAAFLVGRLLLSAPAAQAVTVTSGPTAIAVYITSATLTWTTDVPSDSLLTCTDVNDVPRPVYDSALTQTHTLTCTGLVPGFNYQNVAGLASHGQTVWPWPTATFKTLPVDPQAASDFEFGLGGTHRVAAGFHSYIGFNRTIISGTDPGSFSFAVSLPAGIHLITQTTDATCNTVGTTETCQISGNNSIYGLFLITADASAIPGTYNLPFAVTSAGVTHQLNWTLQVDPSPQPLIRQAIGKVPAIDSTTMSIWQETMTGVIARTLCNESWILANGTYDGPTTYTSASTVWYYDGIRVYDQIADYTGDDSWRTCAGYVIEAYRDNFAIPSNGNIGKEFHNFTNGLRLDYERTQDPRDLSAIKMLADNDSYLGGPYAIDPSAMREVAYGGQAAMNAYALGDTTLGSVYNAGIPPRWQSNIDFLLGQFDQAIDGGPWGSVFVEPFMIGLAMESLIQYYPVTRDPRIPPAVQKMADWLWTNAWAPSANSFVYDILSGPDIQMQNLNPLIAPAYAWLWGVTGDPKYLSEGDQIFYSGVVLTNQNSEIGSGKQFSQSYRWSFDYVKWRTNPDSVFDGPPPPPTLNGSSITSGTFAPHVYPNPWRSDKHNGKPITFSPLVAGGTIKIFTTSGHKVKEISVTGTNMPWNLDNDKGDKVASGIYVYLITDGQGNKAKGKVAVIK